MHKNQDKSLIFVTDDAADYIDKLNFLGAAGMEVAMVYMVGIDLVMSLYEALTGGGRGGAIAHTIMTYRNQAELEQWIVTATPGALGPMLMTLTSAASSFKIEMGTSPSGMAQNQANEYSHDQSQMLQQKAIERILGWIVNRAKQDGSMPKAQSQFEEACMSMNRFGTKEVNYNQYYCENRLRLDNFMAEAVMRLQDRTADEVRARYKSYASLLGQRLDGYCTRITHYGRTYLPGGHASYTGPDSQAN